VLGAVVAVWLADRSLRAFVACCKRSYEAAGELRAAIGRRFSSPKDLSHFALATVRRPRWRRGESRLEIQPCCAETPMFSPSRSRYMRVSALDAAEEAGLLN
jgi:hypothetical protein